MSFADKWSEAVDKKGSILCAGLDPADYEMQRGSESLPEDTAKRSWTLSYIENVAPFCAGMKFNVNYWKGFSDAKNYEHGRSDAEILSEAYELAKSHGMIVIEDAKLPDIGATNDAGMFYAAGRADAVTIAPFAGNTKEIAEQAKKRNIGTITMCLMSNPEFATVKSMLVPLTMADVTKYSKSDVLFFDDLPYVEFYKYQAKNAADLGIDGVVIGAPSSKNHIKENEVKTAVEYSSGRKILIPGIGKQGGEIPVIVKYARFEDCIANVGRALMFPENGDQAAAAKYYFEMLNDLRSKK